MPDAARPTEEAGFVSEQQLHEAIAEYPELIPRERFGRGRLTVLARELRCAAGHVDLILVDEFGRLVVCEIKRAPRTPTFGTSSRRWSGMGRHRLVTAGFATDVGGQPVKARSC